MNDFRPSPTVLSAGSRQDQSSRSPLGTVAVLSLLFDKATHLHIDQLAHAWHDLLFLLLVSSFSLDLIVELIRGTASGLHNARKRFEPVWPAIFELAFAIVSLALVFIPPKWKRHPEKIGRASCR